MSESLATCFLCQLPAERYLAGTANFTLSLCLGPLTPGHIMLIARRHLAGLIDLSPAERAELENLKERIRLAYRELYGPCLFFEHGHHGHDHPEERHHAHAHLHVVPAAIDIYRQISRAGFVEVHGDYRQPPAIPGEYLYYESPDRRTHFFQINAYPEKQFIRKCIAEALGQPRQSGSWESHPGHELMAANRRQLQGRFGILAEKSSNIDLPGENNILSARG
jgi:diadenosine tetraphosphate (Ap4A) HIT family hydrolase